MIWGRLSGIVKGPGCEGMVGGKEGNFGGAARTGLGFSRSGSTDFL